MFRLTAPMLILPVFLLSAASGAIPAWSGEAGSAASELLWQQDTGG